MWRLPVILLMFPLITLFGELHAGEKHPLIRVGVLKYGTVNWELSALQQLGLDDRYGFQLEVLPFATVPATQIALKSGHVDMIVSDWLWVSRQRHQGDPLQLFPYSRSIGQLLVAQDSAIKTLDDLRGKRIGIAGGPLSKGWILLQAAARQHGFDLQTDSTPVFAAPPLLSASFEQGRIDALVTFWHYGARLQSKGARLLIDLQTIATELGMSSRLPMLGYVFSESWAEQNPALITDFYRAVKATKRTLVEQPQSWQPIKHLMHSDNDQMFEYLRKGYIAGVPSVLSAEQVADAQQFYQLLHSLKLAKGWPRTMDTNSFWQPRH